MRPLQTPGWANPGARGQAPLGSRCLERHLCDPSISHQSQPCKLSSAAGESHEFEEAGKGETMSYGLSKARCSPTASSSCASIRSVRGPLLYHIQRGDGEE